MRKGSAGRFPGFIVSAAALVLGAGTAHSQTAAPAPQHGLQADFDAATKAFEESRCADALPIFERLSADPRVKPGSLSAATIALRRGLCAIGSGDSAKAEAWIRSGLPVVGQAGAMAADAAMGWAALGRIALRRYDHDEAVADFNHALALPGMADRTDVLAMLAIATAFDGDGVALDAVDRLLAHLPQGRPTGDARKQEAYARTLRIRILMNLGRYADAYREGDKAIGEAGGLTTAHVSVSDVALRSDVAEAALLIHRDDRARELLAYTGAGRIAESPFAVATAMEVPDCDDSVGMRAEDSAIVEFSIADDGSVADAQTTFTRGNYATARAFAEAVRHWAWQPERVAKLPPFYRALVRVELRCSRGGGDLPGVWSLFDKRVAGWAAQGGDAVGPAAAPGSPGARAAALRARAVVMEAAGDRPGAAAQLMMAQVVDPVVHPGAVTQADKAIALVADADPAKRASAAALRALIAVRQGSATALTAGGHYNVGSAALLQAARQPVIAADALAQDTVLMAAVDRYDHLSRPEADAALHQVADDARLDATSPLRQVALLRLASVAAHAGRHDQAEALFARTGLESEQCALIGDIPRRRTSGSDSDFPMDALRMGFEGWVREEYDITADGRTAAPRAVIAYPPFVFVDSATRLAQGLRYDPSFRPSGKLACSAKTETVRFNIPSNH